MLRVPTFSMRRPDVIQTWIEVMASANVLGAPQRPRAAQRFVGTDHEIWKTVAKCYEFQSTDGREFGDYRRLSHSLPKNDGRVKRT